MEILSRYRCARSFRFRWRKNHWFLLAAAAGLTLFAPADAAPPSPEDQVKAVFLFNFAQFVEWPPRAFSDPAEPLVIGVLGEDPFGQYLDDTVRGEKVGRRPLVVQRFRRVNEIRVCHILFISTSESDRLGGILDTVRGRPILTVGDMGDFAVRGGMIQFLRERSRIRMRINLQPVRAADLTISSKLLRVAETMP